ncbi:Uncharacterized conserved protein, DUF362 family [Tindallia magadiensis]|uniref:Uncharacterized conserved protein, DUF362 family n=1 Tax=Tindallia magadiensis TaxID=69895 RepID=A0A1I3CE24_9FIRM|nr:DUF362 domain-containing protein [Tindallia magadiensis]SFH72788.1 Uncharacterized conserved protein, DUF362 family [Tindallia magadiensis]
MKKVVMRECPDYTPDIVKAKLKESLDALGGLEKWIKPGERVFLKVNLLTGKEPKEAVTTHPQLVKALTELLMEIGALVTLGDSPAGPFLQGRMKKIYQLTGMTAVAKETGASLNWNLEPDSVYFSEGYRLKDFYVMKAINETDHIINVSKMKTHSMTMMTGAVKNMFGIMPGLKKAELYFRFTDPVEFGHAMVDICEYASPILSIMDGIEAMEGAGPSAGDVVKNGLILVSEDPYSLDIVASEHMGITPDSVPTLKAARQRNLCQSLEKVKLDTSAGEGTPKSFKLPDTREPDFLEKYGRWPVVGSIFKQISRKHLRPKPVVNPKKCTKCKECYTICPAEAIDMMEKVPGFRYDKCIRCYCCQEVCPEKAIWIFRPKILKWFGGTK